MTTRAVDLRCEHLRDPIGIGVATPRLSWRTETDIDHWRQVGYQIEARDPGGDVLWDSGRVDSADSLFVAYAGPPLASRQRCEWRIRVWGAIGGFLPGDTQGQWKAQDESDWSEPATFEAGLLDQSGWSATFVTPDWDEDTSESQPCPYLRTEFDIAGEVASARLYVTAMGVYEAEINGARVSDDVLAPGWTSYKHRLRYQTYDVTALLRSGPNAIGAILADGWARGNLGFQTKRNRYTDRLALLAQLEVTLADGSTQRVATDDAWRATTGPILASDIYNGETYDARKELAGWSGPGYDDTAWSGVRAYDGEVGTLVAPDGPPVRRTEEVRPVAITTSPSGKTILDFGQNLVGRLRVRVSGPEGATVTLRHAEVLDEGELFTRALNSAQATDRYTLKGGGIEEYEPRFTFHGFRYAEVDGWPGTLSAGDIVAVVCHSDMERTGWFECSDPDVNKLHENIVWSLRGNFLDVPTDCPQRAERLGWTGDVQVFAPAAALLYDVSGFLASWLADLAADQLPDGGVPFVVPDILCQDFPTSASAAGWSDAATFVPWALYRHFGDAGILAAQYDSMRAWIECMRAQAGDDLIWEGTFQFGDWLDPAAPPDKPGHARADRYFVATAYFAQSARILAAAAAVLGKDDDKTLYRDLADRIRNAFRARFAPDGLTQTNSQTEIVLAIAFDLLPEEQRTPAAARLAQLVADEGGHLGTGFLGTPDLLDTLAGRLQLGTAYELLLQRTCPSWLYPITQGATTIWERWDAIQPDGSINPGAMLSFNHYAFGAVGAWLYGTVAGLRIDLAGWRRFTVRPRPGGGLTHARARVVSPYGQIASAWRIEDGRFYLKVEVPPNTTALVTLPGAHEEVDIGSGRHEWEIEAP